MARFDVRAVDRWILACRLAGAASARWYVLNCEPDCKAHNRLAYRQRLASARDWRIAGRVRLGGP
jgi:hypothetical protein